LGELPRIGRARLTKGLASLLRELPCPLLPAAQGAREGKTGFGERGGIRGAPLLNRKSALKQRNCAGRRAQAEMGFGHSVERIGHVRMMRPKCLLGDGEGALVVLHRLPVAT
jgi:hypothetical protein